MGRKKKRSQQQDIWCFFCDKTFKDEALLLAHQMKQHFKCTLCNKKASNVGGLSNHMMQVHKSVLGKVPNSIAGRDNPKTGSAVNGMSYIPQEALRERAIKLGKDTANQINVKRPKYDPQHLQQHIPGGHMQHNMMMSGMQPQYHQQSYGFSQQQPYQNVYGGSFYAQQQPAQSYYGMPRPYPPLGAPPPGLPPNYMPSIPAQGSSMQSFQRPPPQPPSGMPPPIMNANFAQPPASVGSIQHVATTQAFTNNTNTSNAGAPSLPPPPLGATNMPPLSTPQTITPAIPQNAVPPPNTNFAPPPLPVQSSPGATKNIEKQDDTNGRPMTTNKKTLATTLATTTTKLASNNTTIKSEEFKGSKKSSNVIILFRPEHNMSMEEMRALSWRKKQLLSKFM